MFFNQTQSLQKNPWSGLHVFSSQNSPEKTISTNTKQGSTGSTTSISMQQRKHLRILGEFVNYVRLTLDLILINLKHICLEDLARTKKNVKWMTWRDISVKFVTNPIWTKIVWSLKRHINWKHKISEQTKFECELYKVSYAHHSSLARHIRKMHVNHEWNISWYENICRIYSNFSFTLQQYSFHFMKTV